MILFKSAECAFKWNILILQQNQYILNISGIMHLSFVQSKSGLKAVCFVFFPKYFVVAYV